jgi:hypothetical protein
MLGYLCEAISFPIRELKKKKTYNPLILYTLICGHGVNKEFNSSSALILSQLLEKLQPIGSSTLHHKNNMSSVSSCLSLITSSMGLINIKVFVE